MHKTILAAATALVLTTGAAMAESKTYHFDSFNRIDIATGIHAIVANGDTQTVHVETARNGLLNQLELTVDNGRLKARRDRNLLNIILNGGLLNGFFHDHEITIYITVPQLIGVEAASEGLVEADSAVGENVTVDVASGANVKIVSIAADTLQMKATSGGFLSISGTCDKLETLFASGGRISAQDLACTDIEINGASGASADITASGKVTGKISSSASLKLFGDPEWIDIRSSSGGSVNRGF